MSSPDIWHLTRTARGIHLARRIIGRDRCSRCGGIAGMGVLGIRYPQAECVTEFAFCEVCHTKHGTASTVEMDAAAKLAHTPVGYHCPDCDEPALVN